MKDGEVTGVIDWAESRYGDFLWDVSWINLWSPKLEFKKMFEANYSAAGRSVPWFEERIQCYTLLIFLRVLGFFARTKQKSKVDNMKVRLKTLL